MLATFGALALAHRLDVGSAVAAYAVAEIATLVLVWACARRVGPRPTGPASPAGWWRDLRSNDWRFVRYAYFHSTLKLGVREFDVLLAGLLLEARDVGHLKLVKQLAGGIGAVSLPLFQMLLPALARANARRDRAQFLRLLRSSAVVGLVLGAAIVGVVAAAGPSGLALAFGPEFVPAYGTLLLWLAGTAISLATIGLHPAQLALGRADASFRSLAVAMGLYYAVILAAVPSVGTFGFAVAFVTFYLAWTALQVHSLTRDFDER
jgi:O-antigen/teichoic acid export membrane protein